jgi:hypothetical protein
MGSPASVVVVPAGTAGTRQYSKYRSISDVDDLCDKEKDGYDDASSTCGAVSDRADLGEVCWKVLRDTRKMCCALDAIVLCRQSMLSPSFSSYAYSPEA